MSFKKRLIIAFSIMVLIVGVLGLFTASTVQILRTNYNDYERSKKIGENSAEIVETLQKIKVAVDHMVLDIGLQGKNFPSLLAQLKNQIDEWGSLSTEPEEKDDFEKFNLRLKVLNTYFDQVVSLVKLNEKMMVMDKMDEQVLPELKQTTQLIHLFSYSKLNKSELLAAKIRRVSNIARTMSWILFLATFLVGLVLALRIYRTIAAPMDKLQEGIRKFGAGDWNLKFEHFDTPEIEELAKTMEEMAASLKNLQAKVVQMDRMAAVGTLAGGVAHELNNPLTGVLGIAQILVEKLEPGDKRRVMAEKIHEAAKRCQNIVHSLLSFSRQAEIQLVPTNVNELLNSAISLCQADIHSREILVFYERNNNLPKISVSPNHVQQVFLNLITNAMDAMTPGGKLTILTQFQPAQPGLDENFPYGAVVVTFKDTGSGIAMENIPKVFEPFFTTKDIGKGTGLGLSVSYSIIKQHQGSIQVQSDGLGMGCTFTVTLPALQDEAVKELSQVKDQAQQLIDQNASPGGPH